MINEKKLQEYKLKKFEIDISKLSNSDKLKWNETINLLNDLIKFKNILELSLIGLKEGHYTDLKNEINK